MEMSAAIQEIAIDERSSAPRIINSTDTPTTQYMQRELNDAGPMRRCQNSTEAETWSHQWWDGYENSMHPHSDDLYFSPQRLFELLEVGPSGQPAPVRLLKGSWLLKRAEQIRRSRIDKTCAEHPLRLLRRQEMPEAAFLSAEEARSLPRGHVGYMFESCGLNGDPCWDSMRLSDCRCLSEDDRSWKPLRVASISHGWLTSDHPDPLAEQIVRFADQIEYERRFCLGDFGQQCYQGALCMCCGCGNSEGCCCAIPIRGQQCCTPDNAFASGEFGVFYDWCSLMQKDALGHRTPKEEASFKTALHLMGVWYGHALTSTFIMSELPEGWPKSAKTARFFPDNWLRGKGWPTFERAVSGMVKRSSHLTWRRIVDSAVSRGISSQTNGHRAAPQHPQEFAAELAEKIFTNGADCEVVAGLYADTLAGALGHTKVLEFRACEWTDKDAERLARVLPMAQRVEMIDVIFNRIGKRGYDAIAAAIDRGWAPSLKRIRSDPLNAGDDARLREACRARGIEVVHPLQLVVYGRDTLGAKI